jgi:hypothetical protein
VQRLGLGVAASGAEQRRETVEARCDVRVLRAQSLLTDRQRAAAFAALEPYFSRVLAGEHVQYEREIDYVAIGRRWVHASNVPTRNAQGSSMAG